MGCIGGREVWTSSPTESVMGGIISAWNINVVGVSARVVIASATSEEETAGNSSTYFASQTSEHASVVGVRTPLSIRKPLNPLTPASTSGRSSSAFPGIMPP